MSAKRQRPTAPISQTGRFVPGSSLRTTRKENIPHPGRGDTVLGQRLGKTGEFVMKVAGEPLPPRGISVEQVRKGLPIRALDELAGTLRVERTELAQILGTSIRTLQRKQEASDRLGPAASDRLARIARIHELACQVFGDPEKASIWLTSESRALNEIPLRMLDTDIGTQRVQQELRQIEFGMPF